MVNKKPPWLGRSGRALLLLGALLLCASCEHEPTDSTGGETHFLRRCQPNDGSCGTGLSCVCGVCTALCTASESCSAFANAECAPKASAASCADFQTQGHCEVECGSDLDCTPLSASHRCEQGVCRAGTSTPGAAGAGGAPAGGSGDAGAAGSRACVTGQVPASGVLFIGDSFFALTHQISADVITLARAAGVLGSAEQYRDASSLSDNALALGGTGIADQYSGAAATAPVKVVVMNGGGTDLLLGSCPSIDSQCPLLVAAADAAKALFSQMATDGVQHLVYAYYPDPLDENTQAKVDALRPLIEDACQNSPVPCHWLDLRPTFVGNEAAYTAPDGLNPSAVGSQASAAAIWATMQQSCIAQ